MNETIFNFLFGLTHQAPWLDALIIFLARDLIWLWVAIVLLILTRAKRWQTVRRSLLASFSATLVAWAGSEILKLVFGTARPFLTLPVAFTLLAGSGLGHAFPSAHAAFLFALAFSLYPTHKRLAGAGFAVATLVSAARVAAGLHWPIDILGGFLLAYLVHLIFHYFKP